MTDRGELVILTPEQQVAAILARDAQRVRLLTELVAGLWGLTVLATGLRAAAIPDYLRDPKPTKAWEYPSGKEVPWSVERRHDLLLSGHRAAIEDLAIGMVVVVGLVSVSALGTLYLIHVGRRATARQIQAGLADISKQQLADLRRKAGPLPVEGSHQSS